MSRRGAALCIYLLVAFGLAWAIELGPVRSIGYKPGDTRVVLWLVLVMFTPTLGALAARLVEGEGFSDAGLRWGRGRYHILGWLLPFVFGAIATGVTVLSGAGQLDLTGAVILEKLPEAQRQLAEGQMHSVGAAFPLVVILGALTQGVLITSLATFGEEFGWRGYLQQRLGRLGPRGSLAAVGLIWGVWHAPVIIQGHNYPGHPFGGTLMMIALCVVLSFVLGWLFRRSGSIISPTLGHASLNSPAASLIAFVRGANPLVGNVTGIIGILVMATFVVWLWGSGRLREPEPAPTPTAS